MEEENEKPKIKKFPHATSLNSPERKEGERLARELGEKIVRSLNYNIKMHHIESIENGEPSKPLNDFFYEALKERAECNLDGNFLRLTPRIEMAIAIANIVHKGQWEKGYGVKRCYISHPLRVAEILSKYTQDENTIIADLLHDVIKDSDYVLNRRNYKYTLKELKEDFKDEVKAIVENLSYKRGKSWLEKQKNYLEKISNSDKKTLLVFCADCIDSMRFIIGMYERDVNEPSLKNCDTFDFNAPLGEIARFYEEALYTLEKKSNDKILEELERTNKELIYYLVEHGNNGVLWGSNNLKTC